MKSITNFNHFSVPKPLQHILTRKQSILDQLKTCSNLKNLGSVFASMIKTNASQDCFLVNQFISACSNFLQIDYATLAFTHVESPNGFVYNAMIRGFVHCFHPTQALECYIHMLRAEVMPTSYTFSPLIKACASLSALGFGEAVHCHIWRNGFDSHVFVQTALIDFYSNFGKIGRSRRVFDEMPDRDVYAWTTIVSAYVRAGDLSSARELFEEMPERNTATWNTMIDGYARMGNFDSAELLFNQMSVRDIISWTTMITCYSQHQKFREALAIFNKMTSNGIHPDEVTMATVISACAHLGALDLGTEIHLYILQNGFDVDVYIGSALIDMYAKCGSLDRSLSVFFKLREKNLFCWNSVIDGLAVHGYADEALKMFRGMEREKIKPNGITFISVLSACTHAGLVEEGRRMFLSMTDDYSILPEVGHYGCMVDLLSKAGLLKDALELIRSMKVEPNNIIWGALLGGCKLHRNLEIAQVAVKELMALEPNNSGHYNLLVNMYAEVNRWGEVGKIRAAMKNIGVEKKCPGSSWIEMERKIHQFAASDKSHPASSEIYLLLAELGGQLKLAGYVPELIWRDLAMSVIEKEDWKNVIGLVTNAKQVVSSVQDVARKPVDYAKLRNNDTSSESSFTKESTTATVLPITSNTAKENAVVIEKKGAVSAVPEELFVPGTLFYLKRNTDTQAGIGREYFTLLKRHPGEHFQGIVLSNNLISNH